MRGHTADCNLLIGQQKELCKFVHASTPFPAHKNKGLENFNAANLRTRLNSGCPEWDTHNAGPQMGAWASFLGLNWPSLSLWHEVNV